MVTRRPSAKSAARTLVALGALGLLAGLLDARPGKLAPGDLEGRWRLDEGTGTSAGDSSGNGNTGTLVNGPAWVAGQAGQALSFDGVDDYVTCGTTGMPAANASQTISWWMNYASVPSSVQCVVGLTNDGSSSSVQVGFNQWKPLDVYRPAA